MSNTILNKNRFSLLLMIFISTITLVKLLYINGSRFIQIPEICFIMMLPFCKLSLFSKKLTVIDIGVLSFGLALTINYIVHSDLNIKFEILGCVYLIAFYFVASRLIESPMEMDKILKYGMLGNLAVCFMVAIIGLILHNFYEDHSFFRYYKAYPYFGDTWRLIGLSSNNTIISCLGMSILFLPSFKINSLLNIGFAFIALLVCMMTYNKEIVILIPLWGLLSYYNKRGQYISTKVLIFSLIFLSCLATFFSFFGIKNNQIPYNSSSIGNVEQVNPEVLFSFSTYNFHATTYFYIFKNAITAFLDNPLVGIGFNELSPFIEYAKQLGNYPKDMNVYGSHDIYWGPAAELGMFYVLFLFLIGIGIIKFIKQKEQLEFLKFNSIIACILFFSIGYLISGSIQYRHVWILLIIINFFLLQSQRDSKLYL